MIGAHLCYRRDPYQNECDVESPGTVYYNGTCTTREVYCIRHDYDGYDGDGSCTRGASRYDIRKIFGFLTPFPFVRIWN